MSSRAIMKEEDRSSLKTIIPVSFDRPLNTEEIDLFKELLGELEKVIGVKPHVFNKPRAIDFFGMRVVCKECGKIVEPLYICNYCLNKYKREQA